MKNKNNAKYMKVYTLLKTDLDYYSPCPLTRWMYLVKLLNLICFVICKMGVSVQSLSRVWLFPPSWTAMPGFPVHHQILESVQTHVHLVGVAIHPSVIPFSSCLQSFPASGSFPMSQFFPSGGQSIGVLASASVLPKNIQDWFPLGFTGLISLQSKGLSRVFITTVQKHQFFGTQLSLWSNSYIHT